MNHHRDRRAERAVVQFLLGVGEFRIEPLRIADGELDVVALRDRDQFIGFVEFECDRFFQQDVISRFEQRQRRCEMKLIHCAVNDGISQTRSCSEVCV